MGSVADNTPLVVIVGPTASGKTSLALTLAERFGGEIIAADSRTVYKGMDIGTAKPTTAERKEVSHHLLDICEPNQVFTVADFQRLAQKTINDISSRGKLPLLVGGSGLYVDAVIYSFSFAGPPDGTVRKELDSLTVEQLQARLAREGIDLPRNQRNPRHLVRAIETKGRLPRRQPLRAHTLVIGLDPGKETLVSAIIKRVDQMVDDGFVGEVRRLSAKYGWAAPGLQAPGYKAFRPYMEGTISLREAKTLFVQYDLQYAKRQRTWFKRNQDIHWISKTAEAVDLVTTFLNK